MKIRIWTLNIMLCSVVVCRGNARGEESCAFRCGRKFQPPPSSACKVKLHGTLQLKNASVIFIRCVLRLQHFRFVYSFIRQFQEVLYSLGSALSLSRDVTPADRFLKPRITQRRHITLWP